MAKQLNLLSKGQVITTALHTEMQRSYLEYAMSVIVGRALPDVRDGLKPVHRRILYAMHELGLTPDRPYRKCARVVGDVLGKYHPHGDQSVYDALVRLVQNFSSRYPLLGGHGNFGSVDNDPPAAMRYTETRLAPVGHEGMLAEIAEETVDFTGNFDNSQQEPTVLPAQLPFLLLNGCAGIAVGMATNVPPHNLGEIVDGLIALIDNPDLKDEKLFQLIPGPDFPTGGEIVDRGGIKEAYTTGKGGIVLRGIVTMEEIPATRGTKRRTALIVTELPFQVNKAGWIEKIADLVNQGRLQGISDIRDESDREGMRVVIELKRDTNPQELLQHLYHQTALQTTFGAILLAIVEGQPRQLTLRQLLEEFLKFREHTLNRRYSYELGKAENRLNILAGLLKALLNLDDVIAILRQAADGSTAKMTLCSRLDITDVQADAILAMPLRRLTGLEQQNLQQEFDKLNQEISLLRTLLEDRRELLKVLKKDLRNLKRKYGDPRRTKIVYTDSQDEDKTKKTVKTEEILTPKPEQPLEETIVEVTQRGYVRRISPHSKKPKGENGLLDHDFLIQTALTNTHKDLLILTSGGKVYPIAVGDIPLITGRSARGTPLITMLTSTAQGNTEGIITRFLLPEKPETSEMVLLTKKGRIKRLSLSELVNLSRRGITILKLKDDDELAFTRFMSSGEHLILASSNGRLLRFPGNDEQLPIMGRAAMGLQAFRLLKNQQMVGCVNVSKDHQLLLVTEEGYGKIIAANQLRAANRGDLGIQVLKFNNKTDNLAAMVPAKPGSEVALLTNKERVIRVSVDAVPNLNKDSKGESICQLNRDERIISVVEVE
ncbi:DNA gyrase subunit A [Aphanizomenon flos-aquae NRERC-008]|jgi:DNA gyrase subunit A|uniref:DNA topoisomerase (ATP-hydrolyzing) n=1 Tax=Aphanizomenon flos-aquae FACHB-1249 TaxID=2692889 RepID=A0ABR8IM81_APHFL|nr:MULTISPECIES: DNA gyrase subunit A [Aphanizomenon]MDJ0507369.1 DNA gyrase subunit A [Nostocales cyanobacterium LE14-WE12]MBD2388920.1 DNA gyrase subunit A [Aphanizomenon flos-aquae FACHB-1171]MBD2555552.1 DNA gyrase subunit A [Aphanizomenon flos-aquae FACHB-1290]MBD2629933.1 DNA gyrase subunit A [Aphanizomenon sp. FACHB-1399]MBD2641033.1 DNA gyrase subunit A [Aphanizomenon sp. FACHB-1401]